jgi:hypothetical protein
MTKYLNVWHSVHIFIKSNTQIKAQKYSNSQTEQM